MNEKSRFGEDAANSARSPLALATGSAHFGHMNEIENIDINTLTPVEALMKLNEIKKYIGVD